MGPIQKIIIRLIDKWQKRQRNKSKGPLVFGPPNIQPWDLETAGVPLRLIRSRKALDHITPEDWEKFKRAMGEMYYPHLYGKPENGFAKAESKQN